MAEHNQQIERPINLNKPGVYKNVPYEKYHNIDALRSSILKCHDVSAKYAFQEMYTPYKTTPALTLGNALHTMVLEPELFDTKYSIKPEGIDKRTRLGKEIYQDYLNELDGRTELSGDQKKSAHAMALAIKKNSLTDTHFHEGDSEITILNHIPIDGLDVLLKSRIDRLTKDKLYGMQIVDIKTMSRHLTDRNLSKQVYDYGYHMQAAMQIDAVRRELNADPSYYWLFVQSEPPYDVVWREAGEDTINLGRRSYKGNIYKHRMCMNTGIWPGVSDSCDVLEVPDWALTDVPLRDPRKS